jgi:hypothetical protein
MVISEFLRAQQGVEQVDGGGGADDEHDYGLNIHDVFYFTAISRGRRSARKRRMLQRMRS